jgi:hypothetical protein
MRGGLELILTSVEQIDDWLDVEHELWLNEETV